MFPLGRWVACERRCLVCRWVVGRWTVLVRGFMRIGAVRRSMVCLSASAAAWIGFESRAPLFV